MRGDKVTPCCTDLNLLHQVVIFALALSPRGWLRTREQLGLKATRLLCLLAFAATATAATAASTCAILPRKCHAVHDQPLQALPELHVRWRGSAVRAEIVCEYRADIKHAAADEQQNERPAPAALRLRSLNGGHLRKRHLG